MPSAISERIAIVRILMICGVVLLHVPPYVPLTETGPGSFDFLKAFFQSAVFRCTVPLLTVISGFLLFSSNLDLNPGKLWTKKFKTLAIPFFIFNTLLTAAVYLFQSKTGLSITYQLVPFDLQLMLDAAFGLTRSPLNYPLNFIRDLFVLALLAPMFGWLLRKTPILGLILVALIFRFDLDSGLILRWDMAVLFYLGGMAALQKWNLRILDKYGALLFAFFVLLCIAIVKFKVEDTTCLRLAAPFLIWPAAGLLNSTGVGAWLSRMSKYSYFIFLAHGPILVVTWMAYRKAASLIPYPAYWILAPIVTIALLVFAHRLGTSFIPRAFGWMIGQKIGPRRNLSALPARS